MAKGKGKAKKPGKKEKEEAEAKKRLEEEEAAAEENDIEFQKAILEIRVKELEQLKVGYGTTGDRVDPNLFPLKDSNFDFVYACVVWNCHQEFSTLEGPTRINTF